MEGLTDPRRFIAARLLIGVALITLFAAACGSAAGSAAPGATAAGGGGGGNAGDPAAVVQDALAKIAAKDLNGIGNLACAGQAEKIKSELDMSGSLGDSFPGVDTSALVDSVQLDVSGVKVGTPTISGDTAKVPVTGSMKVSFDKEKLRPILKQVLGQQGQTMTDAQIDTLISTVAATAQDVPLDESLDLKQEGGAWKICEQASASPAASY